MPNGSLLYDAGSSNGALWQSRGSEMGWEVGGWFNRNGTIYIAMADSCWCMAETDTILQSNYPPIKNKFKKENICG